MYYLQIYFPNGRIWSQSGIAHPNFAACEVVWGKISRYLPAGSCANAFKGKELMEKYAAVREESKG